MVRPWVDLEDVMLSEVSQLPKDEPQVISLLCGSWRRQVHRDRKQGGGGGGGMVLLSAGDSFSLGE